MSSRVVGIIKENWDLFWFLKFFVKIIRQIEGWSALLSKNVNKLSRVFSPFAKLKHFWLDGQNLLGHQVQSWEAENVGLKKSDSWVSIILCDLQVRHYRQKHYRTQVIHARDHPHIHSPANFSSPQDFLLHLSLILIPGNIDQVMNLLLWLPANIGQGLQEVPVGVVSRKPISRPYSFPSTSWACMPRMI